MENEIAYCGIDVGLKSHTICLLDGSQNVVKKYSIANDINGFKRLEADLSEKTKVCLEPTGVYSTNIFLYLKNKGCNIRFCKTDSSHDFRESMFNRKKHDRFDALALAKYRIVNEHLTFDGDKIIERIGAESYSYDPKYQVLADLIAQHLSIRECTKKLKNKIKNIIDLRFPEAIQVFPADRGCKTICKALLHPKNEILSGRIKLKQLKEIQRKLKDSIGQYDMKRPDFTRYVTELNTLEERLDELENAIKSQLYDMGYAFLFNYYCLNTIGVAIFVREIRDISRFYRYSGNGAFSKKKSLRAFKKFLGMTVTVNQSGTKEGGHKLTKTGNMTLRTILFLMAMRYVQFNPSKFTDTADQDLNPLKFKTLYDKLVARGTKRIVALTKIMNKITTDLFFIFKDHNDMKITADYV